MVLNFLMKRKNLCILNTLLIILLVGNLFIVNLNVTFDSSRQDFKCSINISDFWNLTATPIYINDNNPGVDDWVTINTTYDWCNGAGTWSDPYVIENITVDGLNINNCIEIRNSNVYFIIRNCTLFNAKSNGAGIYLDNTNNGYINNNNCSYNAQYGIYMLSSDNNTVTYNNMTSNGQSNPSYGAGISLKDSNTNNISLNNVSKNYGILDGAGIVIKDSINNTVSNNTAILNSALQFGSGIFLDNASHTFILNNILNRSRMCGLRISSGGNLTIEGNLMENNGIVFFTESYSNTIKQSNLANGRSIFYYENKTLLKDSDFVNPGQIILMNCNNSDISKKYISNTSVGIWAKNCYNITIQECDLLYNKLSGIGLSDSSNNTVFNNNVLYSLQDGISVYGPYNNISFNNLSYNSDGISIVRDNNILIGNNCSNNSGTGIDITTDFNYVEANLALFNQEGMSISGLNNTVFDNTINKNINNGLVLLDDNNSITYNNISLNNIGISFQICDYNTLIKNEIFSNTFLGD